MIFALLKKKILNNYYKNFDEFNQDIFLMFNNCRKFNQKGSQIINDGIHLEDYYNMLIDPIKKKIINIKINDKNGFIDNSISMIDKEEKDLFNNNTVDKSIKYKNIKNINNNLIFDDKLDMNDNKALNKNELINRKRNNKTKIINKSNKKDNIIHNSNNDDNDNGINLKENENE